VNEPAAVIDTAKPASKPDLWRIAESETAGEEKIVWIRRNPLKNPESAKGIQGNPSVFVWFYLERFGQICIGLCGGRRPPAAASLQRLALGLLQALPTIR
jgi:hypothetical protein